MASEPAQLEVSPVQLEVNNSRDTNTGAVGFRPPSDDPHLTQAAARHFELTDKQLHALQQFREAVGDILQPKHDDYYLVRWLRARNFDLKKAEEMIRNHVAWRLEWGVDSILSWTPPEALTRYYAGGLMGYDRQGAPVWIVEAANFDMKGLSLSVRRQDFLRFIVRVQETLMLLMEQQTQKLGYKVHQAIFINDMHGFGMNNILQPGMDQLTKMMQTVEANYPEIMSVAYIINVPRVFPIMFNIMKPFMHENTRKKIRLIGRDYQTTLREIIDPDVLPKHWGGQRVGKDGDARCGDTIPLGGRVPESLYLRPEDVVGADADITTVTVARGQHHDVTFTVPPAGKHVLRWVFWTIKYDIKFSIFQQAGEGGGKKRVVRKAERINAHVLPVDGYVSCDQPGLYVLRFDNSYSWLHGKEVHYTADLHDVSEVEDGQDEGLQGQGGDEGEG